MSRLWMVLFAVLIGAIMIMANGCAIKNTLPAFTGLMSAAGQDWANGWQEATDGLMPADNRGQGYKGTGRGENFRRNLNRLTGGEDK